LSFLVFVKKADTCDLHFTTTPFDIHTMCCFKNLFTYVVFFLF
jgi:hypothetical protein